jgi:hypothetical protein
MTRDRVALPHQPAQEGSGAPGTTWDDYRAETRSWWRWGAAAMTVLLLACSSEPDPIHSGSLAAADAGADPAPGELGAACATFEDCTPMLLACQDLGVDCYASPATSLCQTRCIFACGPHGGDRYAACTLLGGECHATPDSGTERMCLR